MQILYHVIFRRFRSVFAVILKFTRTISVVMTRTPPFSRLLCSTHWQTTSTLCDNDRGDEWDKVVVGIRDILCDCRYSRVAIQVACPEVWRRSEYNLANEPHCCSWWYSSQSQQKPVFPRCDSLIVVHHCSGRKGDILGDVETMISGTRQLKDRTYISSTESSQERFGPPHLRQYNKP